jgi:demethylmenaquinone methyltransferase/2-methoxy-6-polyprenyl-1,4-benzoquinol methylase
VAADFAAAMLVRARQKCVRRPARVPIRFVLADACRLPFADGSIDIVTIGFGIRNVDDLRAAAGELRRVVAPGGRIVVLEFSLPERRWVRSAYLAYFRHVLPRVGRLVSRHPDAYQYLPDSVAGFESPGELRQVLLDAGFLRVDQRRLTWGIVWLTVADRGTGKQSEGPTRPVTGKRDTGDLERDAQASCGGDCRRIRDAKASQR